MNRLFERLLEQPYVYYVWQAPFARSKFAPVDRALQHRPARRVLDVGCGPGTNASRFDGADYVGVDINEEYLQMARARWRGLFVRADIATADLTSLGRFDTVIVNSFLHPLPDPAVTRVLSAIRRVLTADGRVHVLELVRPDRWSLAAIMARLDRGKYARSVAEWHGLLAPHFEAEVTEPYVLGSGIWSMLYVQGKARSCDSP
jgi:SAM-dependent methyltransferase